MSKDHDDACVDEDKCANNDEVTVNEGTSADPGSRSKTHSEDSTSPQIKEIEDCSDSTKCCKLSWELEEGDKVRVSWSLPEGSTTAEDYIALHVVGKY